MSARAATTAPASSLLLVAILTLKNRTLSPVVERFVKCAREVAKPFAKAADPERSAGH